MRVSVPKKLSKAEKKALEELQKVSRENPREALFVMDDRPIYMISVAAELVGMHPQTLRIYEAKGLVRPKRTAGNTRLYSERDVERLRVIQKLTTELGLNLSGVDVVLQLEDQLQRMQASIDRLQREKREAVEQVHKNYRRDLVPVSQVTTLIPLRRNH